MASPASPDDARLPDEFTAAGDRVRAPHADSATAHVKATTDPYAHTQPQYYHYSNVPDNPSLLANVARLVSAVRSRLSGVIRTPPLPYFPTCWRAAMESSRQYQIPHTPRVISPSPTPSEAGSTQDGYFAPVTRSSTRKSKQKDGSGSIRSPSPIDEDSELELRARARSRSPILEGVGGIGRRRRLSGRNMNGLKKSLELTPAKSKENGNGHLSPAQANKNYWREMSRSPSPLGLIPIHQKWRSFVRSSHPSSRLNPNLRRSTNTRSPAKSCTSASASSPSPSTQPASKPPPSTPSSSPC